MFLLQNLGTISPKIFPPFLVWVRVWMEVRASSARLLLLFLLPVSWCATDRDGLLSSSKNVLLILGVVLIEFYDTLSGQGWHDNTNWLSDTESICLWFGIFCVPQTENVSSMFGETFLSFSFLALTPLFSVLSHNLLSGSLPSSLASLSHMADL